MKHTTKIFAFLSLGAAVALAGCGSGGGGLLNPTSTPLPTSTPVPNATSTPVPTNTPLPTGAARFAGNYTGAFVTIGSLSGANQTGVFSGTADNSGHLTGTIVQDNGPTTAATGTISSNGVFTATSNGSVVVPGDSAPRDAAVVAPAPTATPSPITITFSTKLNGTDTLIGGDAVLSGTALTTQSNGNNPRGRFVGIRNMTTASAFAGTYSGTFNGTIAQGSIPLNGTLAFTVSANGLIRGTFSRNAQGTGTASFQARPIAGTIDKAGDAHIVTLTEVEDPAGSGTFVLVTNTLTGKGTSPSGTKISGTLNRTGSSLANGTATFTATRTSTATG